MHDRNLTMTSQDIMNNGLADENSDMIDECENLNMTKNMENCKKLNPHFIKFKVETSKTPKELEPKICRICLSNESTIPSDFLVSVCKCSGSMKWIHLNCLRRWLLNKIEIVEDDVIRIYAWKELNCELCKTPLESIFFNFMSLKNIFFLSLLS